MKYAECMVCRRRCVPRADKRCGDCRKALRKHPPLPTDDAESPGVLNEGRWVRNGLTVRWEEKR